ncbi:MAG: hypothetical protein JWM11_1643 [Planctomycetaceae bacterium]|nr:hypothetical protein [Planctomycetaceae bacterium]
MSTKAKPQGSANSCAAAFRQGQRNFEKRDFKQALKDARVCYRQVPSTEHRVLLEQASLERARELEVAGLKPQAQDILQELLVQPVTEPHVRQQLPELLSRLGMLDRYPEYRQRLDADPALRAKMTTRAADMAVLRLQDAKDAPPEIRHGAALVIAALDQLDAGQDAESLELLKDISRQSPFADWRLFVRGLAAYYRNDQENAEANWSRLDAQRIPARMTRLLKAIRQTDLELAPSDPNLANAIGALEAALWGAPLLSDFRHLKARAGSGEWTKATAVLRNMRERLRSIDPVALEGITAYLRNQAIRTSDRELLKELTFSTDPLPWDPNWNQARAQLLEQDDDAGTNEQTKFWYKYLFDLDQLTCWTADEIQLAKAIIFERLGKMFVTQMGIASPEQVIQPIQELDPADMALYMDRDWESEFDRPPREFFEVEARRCLEQSLALRPDLLPTHVAYCLFWESSRRTEQAVQARLRLLAQFPDHLLSLEKLVMYHENRNEFQLALPYAMRLIQAKPLSEEYQLRSWELRAHLAREFFMKQDWGRARQELDAARALQVNDGQQYRWYCLQALLEQFLGHAAEYQSSLEQAIQVARHPAPVWFVMTAEAAALKLPSKAFKYYEKTWLAALETPFDPHAAGLMSEFATQVLESENKYTGQVKHLTAITDYLKLGKKATFELSDLRAICQFLIQLKNQKTLTDHYLLHGRGKFRQSGFFATCLAMLNFQLGPEKCDHEYVKQLLNDAQTKIIAGNDLLEKELLPTIQQTLATLEEFDDDEGFFDDDDDDWGDDLPYDEIEFCAHLRREFDRQLAKRSRPGANVANATKKDISKIMRPEVIQEMIHNLAKTTGMSIKDVEFMMDKYGPIESD